MTLTLRPSRGASLVLRPQSRPAWSPAATVAAREVAIFAQDLDPETHAFVGAARELWRGHPEARVVLPNNPHTDRDVVIYARSYGPDGTPCTSDLREATQATLLFRRDTTAPTVGQVGDATTGVITVGVSGFTEFVRRRRLRIAEALTGGGALDNPTVVIIEADESPQARYIDISRTGNFEPDFSWTGGDPAANGFTKSGSGITEVSGTGWRIATTGDDAATYYTLDDWPASAFANGFTLELDPPTVAATDAGTPAQCLAVRVEDGSKRYELRFDADDEVNLNGGTAYAHGHNKVRLVIATGGATADLWVGDTLAADNTTGAASVTDRFSFGDLAGADDADAVWQTVAYALTPVPVRLAQTIYVDVAHSSGVAWGTASAVLELTFANEGSGAGGSTDDFDPTERNKYVLTY